MWTILYSCPGNFYPRSPCGERPVVDNIIFVPGKFLSTLSLRRATRETTSIKPILGISIHALLAESDSMMQSMGAILILFLSTLSLRRATSAPRSTPAASRNFYPRSPCGERLEEVSGDTWARDFYPRSPCGERLIRQHSKPDSGNFYPRSPCGERHDATLHCLRVMRISIHALLAESDKKHINCRSDHIISIHALLAESDGKSNKFTGSKLVFLSTLSLRRATQRHLPDNTHQRISIHALLAESDRANRLANAPPKISIHALLAESDNTVNFAHDAQAIFLSTLSLRRATHHQP